MEGLSENTDEWDQRFNKLRSFRTAQLIKALEKRAKSLEDNSKWKSYFRELAEYLEQSKDDRHRAVHGRHFFDGSNVNIDMANRPSQFTEVPPSLAGEAISNADRILRNLMQFCREAAKN